jgi:general secretion pathway protein D
MRYRIEGKDVVITRDTPYLHLYKINYVNMARNATLNVSVSSQLGGGGTTTSGGSGGGGPSGATNSSTALEMTSNNKFWDSLIANIKDILRETDKVLPAVATSESAQPPAASPAAPPPSAGAAQQGGAGARPVTQPVTYREAASVIANPETGVLTIRATSRQHAKIQEFLDHIMASAKRQVLVEATVAEVQLNNEYQRGIDWSASRSTRPRSIRRPTSRRTPSSSAIPSPTATSRRRSGCSSRSARCACSRAPRSACSTTRPR